MITLNKHLSNTWSHDEVFLSCACREQEKQTKLMSLETNPAILAGFLVHKEVPLKALIKSNLEDNLFCNLA